MFLTIKPYLYLNCVLMLKWIIWNGSVFWQLHPWFELESLISFPKTHTSTNFLIHHFLTISLHKFPYNFLTHHTPQQISCIMTNFVIVLMELWYESSYFSRAIMFTFRQIPLGICCCLPPDRTWHKVNDYGGHLGEGKVGHKPKLKPCWSVLLIDPLSAMWV